MTKMLTCNRQTRDVSYENDNPDGLSFCETSSTKYMMFSNRLCSRDNVVKRTTNRLLSADACSNNMSMR